LNDYTEKVVRHLQERHKVKNLIRLTFNDIINELSKALKNTKEFKHINLDYKVMQDNYHAKIYDVEISFTDNDVISKISKEIELIDEDDVKQTIKKLISLKLGMSDPTEL